MREIKFRAWDGKRTKKMYSVILIDFENEIIQTKEKLKFSDGMKLMQFTGLKDKNGKEIYEGDILQSYPTQDVRFIVVYGQTSENEYGWGLSNKDKHIYSFEKCVQKMEVIGNIYENPELK